MSSFYVGIVAGVLCTISFIPQVVKVLKTKDTSGLSLITFIVFTLGVFFWLLYGLIVHEMPIILANSATLVLASIILAAKVKYG